MAGILFLLPVQTMAQTFCDNGNGTIPKPAAGFGVTSNMGHRDTGIQGASKWHKGTDYATPCGSKIAGPPAGCVNMENGSSTNQRGGYGYTAKFDCGNGIQIQYAHLDSANSYSPTTNLITTGNSGVGGCHLDYILTIDGKTVDAQCATGSSEGTYRYGNSSTHHNKQCPINGSPNLCDNATREALRQHSDEVFSGSGGRNNYSIADGVTTGGGDSDPGNEGDNVSEEGGVYIFLGTGDIDGVTGSVDPDVPDSDVVNDPEDVLDDPKDPADEYNPETAIPICLNSTCITPTMINTANNNSVTWERVEDHNDKINAPKESKCIQPHATGPLGFKQVPGKLEEYNDAFCTQQGCSLLKSEGGEVKCVP